MQIQAGTLVVLSSGYGAHLLRVTEAEPQRAAKKSMVVGRQAPQATAITIGMGPCMGPGMDWALGALNDDSPPC